MVGSPFSPPAPALASAPVLTAPSPALVDPPSRRSFCSKSPGSGASSRRGFDRTTVPEHAARPQILRRWERREQSAPSVESRRDKEGRERTFEQRYRVLVRGNLLLPDRDLVLEVFGLIECGHELSSLFSERDVDVGELDGLLPDVVRLLLLVGDLGLDLRELDFNLAE